MASLPKYVMEPPPGEVRTEVNPPSNGAGIVPAAVATTVIAMVFVGLRIFTRGWIMRGAWGLDDYLVIISMVLSIAFCGLSIKLVQLGCGLHMWDVLFVNYSPPYLATTLGITFTYCTCVSTAKLSILVLYLRLSPDRWFRIGVFALIGVVCTYTVAYCITILLLCTPVQMNWDLTVQGSCISRIVPMMVLSVANILIDVAILLTPVRVVAPLQMPRRQKMSVLLLFVTGVFVIVAAIYRTYILPDLINAVDYTWENPDQNIWGSIEANAGIICASVPALKPLFSKYLPFLLNSSLRGHSNSYEYNGGRKSGGAAAGAGTNSGTGYARRMKNGLSSTIDRNSKRRNHHHHPLSSSSSRSQTNNKAGTTSTLSYELSPWEKHNNSGGGTGVMMPGRDNSSSQRIMDDGSSEEDERRLWPTTAASLHGHSKSTSSETRCFSLTRDSGGGGGGEGNIPTTLSRPSHDGAGPDALRVGSSSRSSNRSTSSIESYHNNTNRNNVRAGEGGVARSGPKTHGYPFPGGAGGGPAEHGRIGQPTPAMSPMEVLIRAEGRPKSHQAGGPGAPVTINVTRETSITYEKA